MSMNFDMYSWATDLFPICRSLTGEGNRQTLLYLKNILPLLQIKSVPTGYKAYDWVVPEEWSVDEAFIADLEGNRIVDFKNNNLHLVGYSEPYEGLLTASELKAHLYTLPELPSAIPYITSYYKKRWGFCLPHRQYMCMNDDQYFVKISSKFFSGQLNYADLKIPSTNGSTDEVFFSTYICHPSMANNELSGPVVATALAKWLMTLSKRSYNYRFVFIPETIGSLVYLSLHLDELKRHVKAGFNMTCVGDQRAYSFLPSRHGCTLSDRVGRHVMSHIDPTYKQYSWSDRGSDERQYCSPGADLPIASLMRTKYGEYPEYHTSLDTLGNVVTHHGLQQSLRMFQAVICALESNCFPIATFIGEPQLGKRGLYPTLTGHTKRVSTQMIDLLSYSDGQQDLLSISDIIGVPIWELSEIYDLLSSEGLIKSL